MKKSGSEEMKLGTPMAMADLAKAAASEVGEVRDDTKTTRMTGRRRSISVQVTEKLLRSWRSCMAWRLAREGSSGLVALR